jgi:deoxyribose-phosphate aldolase
MENYALLIDHTNLSPQCSLADLKKLCQEASENSFKSVCVPPHYVRQAKELLRNTSVLVCTVIGFPLGYSTTAVKAFETKNAIENGADEIDMVINNCLVKESEFEEVTKDIAAVVQASQGRPVKVILETCLLEDQQIVSASKCAQAAGAKFVKTSTGFSKSGASLDAVKLMKQSIPSSMEVKASGGIRDYEKADLMVKNGATRLGTSASLSIVNGNPEKEKEKGSY